MTMSLPTSIRDELDRYERELPGHKNRINFFFDAEFGDWVCVHRCDREAWHTSGDIHFGRRHKNQAVLLSLLRAHVAERMGGPRLMVAAE